MQSKKALVIATATRVLVLRAFPIRPWFELTSPLRAPAK